MHTATLGTVFEVGVPRELLPPTPFRCKTSLGPFELSASQSSPGVTSVLIYFESGAAVFTHGAAEDSITFYPRGDNSTPGGSERSPWGLVDTTEVCEFGVRLVMFLDERYASVLAVAKAASRGIRDRTLRAPGPGERAVSIPAAAIKSAPGGGGLIGLTQTVILEGILLAMAGLSYPAARGMRA